jgi:hypothetical protein
MDCHNLPPIDRPETSPDNRSVIVPRVLNVQRNGRYAARCVSCLSHVPLLCHRR